MPSTPALIHGVMEGNGAYNRHSALQAGGAALALPLWEKAVQSIELDTEEQPIVIADYGSSQGKNSLLPVRSAISTLRRRIGTHHAISVFHVDQPANDFSTLFAVLNADPDRYVPDEANVFPAAIRRSFYGSVLPPGSVHLDWSSYAAQWLSDTFRHSFPATSFPLAAPARHTLNSNARPAEDWEAFLSLRSKELRPGGRLVVVLPGLADDGSTGFNYLVDETNAVLKDMVAEALITADERSRMTLGVYPRRKRDLLAPLSKNGKFEQLTVEVCEMSQHPDAAWFEYERDGDKAALITKHALFARSILVPFLASALARVCAGNTEAIVACSETNWSSASNGVWPIGQQRRIPLCKRSFLPRMAGKFQGNVSNEETIPFEVIPESQ